MGAAGSADYSCMTEPTTESTDATDKRQELLRTESWHAVLWLTVPTLLQQWGSHWPSVPTATTSVH
jgi:hypothetical protein